MARRPAVSVILTSYNHELYVREAINSVLNQSFRDFELIIWDDASTDASWEIINSYSDPRIRSFRSRTNDVIRNLRTAISEANGAFIAIHHSDDVWEPHKLEKQVLILEQQSHIGAVFSNALIIDKDGEPFEDKTHFYYNIFDQPNRNRHEWLNYFFYYGNALCHPSVLIRKTCYDDCGPYRCGFAQLPDFDMWVRLCMKHDIHVLPDKLVRFRVHPNEQNTSGNRPDTRIRGQYEFLHLYNNYRGIHTSEELVKIFPNAARFITEEGCDVGFALAMIALEFDTFINPAKLFGLNLIFEAMNDAVRADMIHRLYGFSHADFLALTAMHDIFSVELATSLTPEVTKKKQALRTLQAPRHRRQPGDDSLQPPLVSIIVPCFNDGVYLAEAMSSIFSQTYKPIETIIVNDGSTDKETKRILSTASWPCTTIVNSANRGPAAARNTGIAAARGKYILPLDADDRIAPSYVERAVAVLESREEVGIVYCHADFFGRKRGRWHLPPYSIEQILLDNVIFATALFRKDDWKAVNGYDEELRQGMEDYDFWLSLIEMGREVVQLPEVLFHYRITGRSRTNKFLEKKASVYETYQRIYRNHPRLYSEYHELSTTVLRNALIDHILWKKLFDSTLGRYPAIFNAIKHILSRSKSILHKVFNETSV